MSDAGADRVAIVGAGPAGALLALILSDRGIPTTLIERQSDFAREFRGEVLMPGGRAMLAQAAFDLGPVAVRIPKRVEGFLDGRPVLDQTVVGHDDEVPWVVSQPELLEHLVEAAGRNDAFEFLRGTSVLGVEGDAERPTGLRLRNAAGESRRAFRYLIGADGRASVVRRRLGFAVAAERAPMDVVWFKVAWPSHWSDERMRVHLGGGHLLLALPAADGLLQVAWVILKGTYGALRARGIEEWLGEMRTHVDAELADHLHAERAAIEHPFLLDAQVDCVGSWTRPGALLIGDAAHTMSPVGAQGLNLAMRDAVVAANHLVPALTGGGAAELDAAAARIGPERMPEIGLIQRLADLPPKVVLGRSALHGVARRCVGRMISTRIGLSLAIRQMQPFLHGVRDVSLSV